MSRKTKQPNISCKIRSGPVSTAQKRAWMYFWRRLVITVREESHSEAIRGND